MILFPPTRAGAFALVLWTATCHAWPQGNYAVKEAHPIPAQWTLLSDAPADYILNVDIALKQGNFDRLEQDLYEVSDPDHPRYGQHLSHQDVLDLVQPSSDTLDLVHAWLADHGIASTSLAYSPAKDWISTQLPVGTLSRLVQADFAVFQDPRGTLVVRSSSGAWSLPANLHDHIDLISPTNSFFRPRSRAGSASTGSSSSSARRDLARVESRSNGRGGGAKAAASSGASVASVCNTSSVDTLCLRTYYGTVDYVPKAAHKNGMSVSDYLGESSNRSDTRIFLSMFRPDAVEGADTFRFDSINGGPTYQALNASQLAEGLELEGDLEVNTVLGIAYPTPLTVFTTAGTPPFQPDAGNPTDSNEPYLTWLNHVLAQPTLPLAMSNSYDDDEQTVPPSYARRVCAGLAQLGARGVSVFFPSGDSGVGPADTCLSNDPRTFNASVFLPVFPTSCPYVTAVGGTMGFAPEVAAYDPVNDYDRSFITGNFSSGGGFSNYFLRPRYQGGAVDAYVRSLGGRYAGMYNPQGRGYPDIAAQAVSVASVWNGSLVHIDGTKCGVVTAVFALVNDARLAEGKPPMGFLNPWLYKRGHKGLNDIVSGSAVGCGVDGFPAREGWDAVTGWGSPKFEEILELLP